MNGGAEGGKGGRWKGSRTTRDGDEGEGEEGEGGGEREREKGREEGRRREGPMSVNEGADGLVHQLLPAVWSDVRHRHAQEINSLCLSSQKVIALVEIFR